MNIIKILKEKKYTHSEVTYEKDGYFRIYLEIGDSKFVIMHLSYDWSNDSDSGDWSNFIQSSSERVNEITDLTKVSYFDDDNDIDNLDLYKKEEEKEITNLLFENFEFEI